MPPKRTGRRVLLAATVGLATLTLTGCSNTVTSGNLMAPPQDAGQDTGPNDAGQDASASTNDAAASPDAP